MRTPSLAARPTVSGSYVVSARYSARITSAGSIRVARRAGM